MNIVEAVTQDTWPNLRVRAASSHMPAGRRILYRNFEFNAATRAVLVFCHSSSTGEAGLAMDKIDEKHQHAESTQIESRASDGQTRTHSIDMWIKCIGS